MLNICEEYKIIIEYKINRCEKISLHRHLRLSADFNNMSWRVRPEELLLEVGKQFSSKINLHQAISDANVSDKL